MKKETMNYFMAPLFFFVMLIDAHLTSTFISWSHDTYVWGVHLLLLLMLFSGNLLSKRYMILSALLIGSIFDLYYIGVLGIYAVALPLVIWLMYIMHEAIYQNILTRFFGMIILITSLELITAGIQALFNLTAINGIFFVTRFLGPTLLINIIFFFVLYYPMKRLFEKK